MPAGGLATHAAPPAFETQHLAMSAEPATADYYRHAFPEVVEVMIRVLTDEGARRISAFENGRLQAVAVNPDGRPYAFRIIDPRQFILTTTFDL